MVSVIVNTAAILLGGAVGLLLKKGIPKRFSGAIMTGIGLCVSVIGISGALKGENLIILVVSIVLGAITGTALKLDDRLTALGEIIERKFTRSGGGGVDGAIASERRGVAADERRNGGTGEREGIAASERDDVAADERNTDNSVVNSGKSSISQGFVTASLLFCVGAMAIVGSINSGLTGDHTIIFAKSAIDLISAVILAASLGAGVLFSAASVFLYQGLLVLLAQLLRPLLGDPALVAEIGCAGSVIIIALGLNLIGITKIKVADFLPAILFVPIVYTIARLLSEAVPLLR